MKDLFTGLLLVVFAASLSHASPRLLDFTVIKYDDNPTDTKAPNAEVKSPKHYPERFFKENPSDRPNAHQDREYAAESKFNAKLKEKNVMRKKFTSW